MPSKREARRAYRSAQARVDLVRLIGQIVSLSSADVLLNSDAMYLMWAVSNGSYVEYQERGQLLEILQGCFTADHPLFDYIMVKGKYVNVEPDKE